MPILAAILVFSVAACAISYSLFVYEATNAPDTTRPLPPGSLLPAFLWGVGAMALTILAYPLGFVSFLWRPRGKRPTSRPEVVFLHGLYHTPAAWILFAPALAMAGLGRAHAPGYNSFGAKTFEDIARDMTSQVHAILDRSPRILLVGHSMGGLLVRRLLADPRIARATDAAVVLGAPHQGSKVAALAPCGRSGRQLLPGSPLFSELAALPDPDDLSKLNILSPADDMVLPNASCAFPGPGWTPWTSPPVSHVGLLYHPGVIRRVADFFKTSAATGHRA